MGKNKKTKPDKLLTAEEPVKVGKCEKPKAVEKQPQTSNENTKVKVDNEEKQAEQEMLGSISKKVTAKPKNVVKRKEEIITEDKPKELSAKEEQALLKKEKKALKAEQKAEEKSRAVARKDAVNQAVLKLRKKESDNYRAFKDASLYEKRGMNAKTAQAVFTMGMLMIVLAIMVIIDARFIEFLGNLELMLYLGGACLLLFVISR